VGKNGLFCFKVIASKKKAKRMETKKKKALIIELKPCHHELIPSWIWALNRACYEVDLFVSPSTPAHRNVVKYVKQLTPTFIRVSVLTSWDGNKSRYDIVLNNTVYPDNASENKQIETATQIFNVLHSVQVQTPNLQLQSTQTICTGPRYKPQDTTTRTLALGPHMHTRFQGEGLHSIFAPPIYFGPLDDPIHKPVTSKPIRFAVQGMVESFRRNYACLPGLLNKFSSIATLPEFEICVIGEGGLQTLQVLNIRVNAPYRSRLKHILNPDYGRYLGFLQREAHWVMPCVDETFIHGYFTHKITSSIMLAVGNGVPLLLYQKLADIYGLTDGLNCICYQDSTSSCTLEQAFLKALTMNAETYAAMRLAVLQFRENWLRILEKVFE
jgi:hypothetical protein